jgi:crotonobetainyl-CoA:carnitine CoA-transferase CaiB-like acyl-CoA transferase
MGRYVFEGVHVLDFAWVGVGPITTKYLADNGADVIRVESVSRLDVLRIAPPWKDGQPGPNNSQFFASFNTSKKGITIDLAKPKARELVLRLLPWADIVSESFTPKAMRTWGLDYERLRQIKSDLIMFSTCMQGQTGPNAMYPGFGQLMAAMSGFYYISGYGEGEPPAPPYGAYSDFIVPRFLAAALIAALDYKRRTGKGQYIDVSQYEASLHNLAPALVDYFATGRSQGPKGNASLRYSPHGSYRCEDEGSEERWIAIAVANDLEWRSLLKVFSASTDDPRFSTQLSRIENRSQLDELVDGLTRRHRADDLTTRLQAAGVAAYPVQNCVDLHQDENLAAFGFWNWLEHQHMGPSSYEGLQHRLSRTPGELRSAAPVLGQHNDEVFHGMLGLTSDEVAQLQKENVIF